MSLVMGADRFVGTFAGRETRLIGYRPWGVTSNRRSEFRFVLWCMWYKMP